VVGSSNRLDTTSMLRAPTHGKERLISFVKQSRTTHIASQSNYTIPLFLYPVMSENLQLPPCRSLKKFFLYNFVAAASVVVIANFVPVAA